MHLLVLRFSAMGDVALSQPVIKKVLEENPEVEITLVSRPAFAPLFKGLPRFHFYAADFNKEFKGTAGIFRLFRKLKQLNSFDMVVDLHSVMRTWILGGLFQLQGKPVNRIKKGRKEKLELTRKSHKYLRPLPHTTKRYQAVFEKAAIKSGTFAMPSITISEKSLEVSRENLEVNLPWEEDQPWIGLAPFAKHAQKTWPLEKTEALIQQLVKMNYRILLFGGGKKEETQLQKIADAHAGVINLAGKTNLYQEMAVITRLEAMITMDSFNMHLATLLGTKVISIWGATHPHTGFGPLGKNENFVVQIPVEELNCRPCSVFGNKPCWRGDLACLNRITPEMVLEKLSQDQ